jgi:hypothetical protein
MRAPPALTASVARHIELYRDDSFAVAL